MRIASTHKLQVVWTRVEGEVEWKKSKAVERVQSKFPCLACTWLH